MRVSQVTVDKDMTENQLFPDCDFPVVQMTLGLWQDPFVRKR